MSGNKKLERILKHSAPSLTNRFRHALMVDLGIPVSLAISPPVFPALFNSNIVFNWSWSNFRPRCDGSNCGPSDDGNVGVGIDVDVDIGEVGTSKISVESSTPSTPRSLDLSTGGNRGVAIRASTLSSFY